MRIVIEMSEEYYNIIKAIPDRQCDADMLIIKRGTPLNDVFDKIKAEIEQNAYPIVHGINNHEKGMTLHGILQVIDKYKAESEE